ncbi:MAG: PD-(D/E)XK nuclease family protein, partial [Bacteroidota bacterium]
EPVSVPTFKQFLFEAIRETTIPFTGEPINPIQVMGMLESRALDFENVIILSCNEGVLPQGKSYNSIIPFDVKKQFGLPTHLASESSFAYTFYRLLHRAKRITLVYTTDSDATGGGEKSRYLAQIEHEMAEMENITLKKRQVNLPLPQRKKSSLQITKSEDIQFRLRTYLTKEGLTPTYISRYLNDPLQFFQQKILGLYEDRGVEEELQAVTFGNLIHGAIERLFESLVGKTVTPDNIQALRKTTDFDALLTEVLAEQAGGILQDRGKTYLLKQTAANLLLDFLEQQEEDSGFQLIAQEHKMEAQLSVTVSEQETIMVKLCGTADRIIQTPEGSLHLIDFKTGKFDERSLKIESVQQLLYEPKKRYVVQLVLYRYLLLCAVEEKTLPKLTPGFTLTNENIISDFLYFKALDEKLKTYTLKEEPKDNSDFKNQVERFITVLVRDMLDASKPFSESLELVVEEWKL